MVPRYVIREADSRYFLLAPSNRCGMGAVCCFILVGTRISRVGWVNMQRPVWFTAQEVFYPSYKCMPKIILGRVPAVPLGNGCTGWEEMVLFQYWVLRCVRPDRKLWIQMSIPILRNVPIRATSHVGHFQRLLPATLHRCGSVFYAHDEVLDCCYQLGLIVWLLSDPILVLVVITVRLLCCSKNFTKWLWMMCSATLQLTNRDHRTGTQFIGLLLFPFLNIG